MKPNRYESSPPRGVLGLFAVAMVVITMGVMVVLPARIESACADSLKPAAASAAQVAPDGGPLLQRRADVATEFSRAGRGGGGCARSSTPVDGGEFLD